MMDDYLNTELVDNVRGLIVTNVPSSRQVRYWDL